MADIGGIVKDVILGAFGCAGLWKLLEKHLDDKSLIAKAKIAAESKASSAERRILTEAGMLSLHTVSDVIEKNFAPLGADRVILFSGHNCGGVPSPGKPYYVTAMQWYAANPEHMERMEAYRRIRVDPAYIKMLYCISCPTADEPNEPGWRYDRNNGLIVLKTDEMDRCQLKTYYEAEGVVESVIVFLGITDFNLYYMSIARHEGSYSEANISDILLQTNRIAPEVLKW